MVLTRAVEDLKPGECEYILNCYLEDGKLRPFPEPARFGTAGDSATSPWGDEDYMIFAKALPSTYGGLDEANFIVVVTNAGNSVYSTHLVTIKARGDFSTVELMSSSAPPWGGQQVTDFVACIGMDSSTQKVFVNENSALGGDLLGYDAVGGVAVVEAGFYASDMVYHQQRFWAAKHGVAGSEATLFMSNTDDPGTWPHTYVVGRTSEYISKILPIAPNAVLVFKEESIHLVRGYPGNLSIVDLQLGVGCEFPSTIRAIPGSQSAIFLDTQFNVRVVSADGSTSIVSESIGAANIRRMMQDPQSATGELRPVYAAFNHLWHYYLLPFEPTTAYERSGLMFDLRNNFWATWIDFLSDETTAAPRPRIMCDSVNVYNKEVAAGSSDISGTPHQFLWQSTFDNTNDLPWTIFKDAKDATLCVNSWAVRTRKIALPDLSPFKISGGYLHAAVREWKKSVLLKDYARIGDVALTGTWESSLEVWVPHATRDDVRRHVSAVHDGSANWGKLKYATFTAEDWSAYSSFEIDVVILPIDSGITYENITLQFLANSGGGDWLSLAASIHGPGHHRLSVAASEWSSVTLSAVVTTGVNVYGGGGSYRLVVQNFRGVLTTSPIPWPKQIRVDYLAGIADVTDMAAAEPEYIVNQPVELDVANEGRFGRLRRTDLPPASDCFLREVQVELSSINRGSITLPGSTTERNGEALAIRDLELVLATKRFVRGVK